MNIRHALGLALGIALLLLPAGAGAEDSAFEFDGAEYFLRSDEGGILEYLTYGDKFEKWSTLISTRESSATDDPHAFAAKLLKNAKASGPDVRGLLMENKEEGIYIVDFLLSSADGEEPAYAEWNVWRVAQKGDGVQAVQYARRFYDFDAEDGQTISEEREKIIGDLAAFEVPEGGAPAGGAAESGDSSPSEGVGEMQTYTRLNDAGDPVFTMQIPADWKLEPDMNGAHIVSADKLFTTSVVVVDTADAEDAVKSIMEQNAGRYAECVWNGGGEPMEKTDPATGVRMQSNDGLAQDKGVSYKVGVALFSKEGAEKSFILSTWMPEKAAEANMNEVFGMLSSIKLH
jgi:hypothetical protein